MELIANTDIYIEYEDNPVYTIYFKESHPYEFEEIGCDMFKTKDFGNKVHYCSLIFLKRFFVIQEEKIEDE